MKVLVVGFPKTGTTSLCAALTTLGYRTYDFEHNGYYLGNEWIQIMTSGGSKEDFYRMYKDVDATMDIPACVFWEKILEAFPETKLIFTRRESEEIWLNSWVKQQEGIDRNVIFKIMAFVSPTMMRLMEFTRHTGRVAVSSTPPRLGQVGIDVNPTVAKMRYRNHNANIIQRAPKDQMLAFNLADGWKPLCEFLDKPIPDTPFPHKNKNGSGVGEFIRESPIFIRMKREFQIFMLVLGGIVAIFLALILF